MLGRGANQDSNGDWRLTPLFEICDEKGAHLPVRLPENDGDPRSCIGGGEIIVKAGVELYKYFHPAMSVFAFGAASAYLHNLRKEGKYAPSECEVGTREFLRLASDAGEDPGVTLFDEAEWNKETSGTDQELHNIFTLATRLDIKNVAIVTVDVHCARTSVMIAGHMQNPDFAGRIFPQLYVAEQILENSNPENYSGFWERSVHSQSYFRTHQREIGFGGVYPRGGINAYFAGIKQTASSIIGVAAR